MAGGARNPRMSAAAAVVKLMIRTRPVASVTVREKRGAVHRQRRPPYAADVGAAAERGRQERLRARPPQILSASRHCAFGVIIHRYLYYDSVRRLGRTCM